MIAFITICYSLLYIVIFNKLGLLKKTAGNISAFAGVGVALIASIVFMWYTFSPMSSDARMFRYIIPIVPNVKGHVEEVPIEALQHLGKGDTLFRIDPEPYEIAVRQAQAQVRRYEAEHELTAAPPKRAWIRPTLSWKTRAGNYRKLLPQGAGGTSAIYTEAGKPGHVISKVAIRRSACLAYLTSS